MNAIKALLSGLIDYAGLYPPASLDMRAAARNYLEYRNGAHRDVLGRFIVDIVRLTELRDAAGDEFRLMRLSVIMPAGSDPDKLTEARKAGFGIESVELKSADAAAITAACLWMPPDVECYHEIPLAPVSMSALDTLKASGARAKLRMGGVAPEAIPAVEAIVPMLQALIARRIAFKATAGLHHPIRSRHKLTYAADSVSGTMHGFLNLLAAVALLRHGGSTANVYRALDEQDARAFRISADQFGWREFKWTTGELHSMRRECLVSFGSCSFTEPIADLEALGWL